MNDACNPHLTDACQRQLWATLPAIVFVAFLLVISLPINLPRLLSKVLARVHAPFLPTLTLVDVQQLERQFALEELDGGTRIAPPSNFPPLSTRFPFKLSRYSALFTGLPLVEFIGWLVLGTKTAIPAIYHARFSPSFIFFTSIPFFVSITWAYAFIQILHRPPVTTPFRLFILFILHLCGGVLILGGQLYSSGASGTPLPSRGVLVAESIHLGIVIILLTLVMSLPLNVRSEQIEENANPAPSPEDYTSLLGWTTFTWVHPLINAGIKKTLNDEDVWDISPTMKSRFTFFAFQQTPGSSLAWRLIRANSMDLLIDLSLTLFSVLLDFSGPFFLRIILRNLENPQPGSRNRAYLFGVLIFAASLIKIQVDLQHFWCARRASSRIETQLSASIYEKTLRIIDQSGVVDVTLKSEGKDSSQTVDHTVDGKVKTGVDVGKVVNLMGIDCQKIQDMVSESSDFYGAPIELALACWFLYDLLGMSAFAGFVPLALAIPLSRLLASMVERNFKGVLACKDKRMKLLNEMFGSIKFIKFFAWEEPWIQKIMDARKAEMHWLKRARNVNVWYTCLWTLVPNTISITSLFVYVITAHELPVSVAFTAIRVFDILKNPLSALPVIMANFTQTKVSLERLAVFLNEREVPEDVCSFTRVAANVSGELFVESGTFRWMTGESATSNTIAKTTSPLPPSEIDSGAGVDNATTATSTSTRTAVDQPGGRLFELKDINVRIPLGKLTVVTGPTASGKTALLMALLGEMDRISGSASIPKNPTVIDRYGLRNSISYAAQTPWLQQQSIKDNILFGYPFDAERYSAVVDACALNPDFQALEDGDLTEIGSKGVSLSGGQKSRVALARAIYAPTQFIILDDIFSAVDSQTARFLFDHLLKGPLVTHRTVLLVTHHVELVLPDTHYIIQMSGGRIERQGSVEELREQGLLGYIVHDLSQQQVGDTAEDKEDIIQGTSDGYGGPKQAKKLVEDEVRAEGNVKWSTYKKYLKASSYWTWVCVMLSIIIRQGGDVGARVWMSVWGSAYQTSASLSMTAFSGATSHLGNLLEHRPIYYIFPQNMTVAETVLAIPFPDAHIHPLFYVAVYSAISVLASLVAVAGLWVALTGGLHGGLVLFEEMLVSLSRASFRFFDTTPMGRILNRFTKDIDRIDTWLPHILRHMPTSLASFIGAVITVAVVVPWSIPLATLVTYCYVKLSTSYLATSRDLRRLESTSRSPILAAFSDLLNGIVTVRAFSAERQFLHGHFKRVDTSQRFGYFMWMVNRWLMVYFDVLGAVSVLGSTIFVIAGYVPVGYAALSIVSAMSFSSSIYWSCRGVTELELCFNSVERVVEYLDIPHEPPAIIENHRVPAYWPSSSDSDSMLVVENLEVKYAPDLPSVLHGISFSLKSRERVGIIGRTGCGKSTLAMSLLRFVEPTKGRIIIDGIDIASIGTSDLRSRVTFIPQDATLFAGTIRDNLDPFKEHSDEECLDALARVHLINLGSQRSSRIPSRAASMHEDQDEIVQSSSAGSDTTTQNDIENKITITLNTTVSAGGQNFSNGQRQLLAMARALLRQSGVVILDEATSSIDKVADVKIQAAIREEFNRSLLLTIAHRLGTIIDFDRLIVLDKGRIAEFDTPYNLIRREGGVFREMCIQSGTYKELEAAAKAQTEQKK